nr:citrate/2-methylcitrate synthase [Candidatus Microthrix sp.]
MTAVGSSRCGWPPSWHRWWTPPTAGRGEPPVEPDPSLGHAASYLYETTGVVPTPVDARAVEQYLILTLDHGFNASTFTARVVASTGADVADAVSAASARLPGHCTVERPAGRWTPSTRSAIRSGRPTGCGEVGTGRRIQGFSNAVYRASDPRSGLLREVAERHLGGPLVERAVAIEAEILVTLAELKPDVRCRATWSSTPGW